MIFDPDEARDNLAHLEKRERESREATRKEVLEKAQKALRSLFDGSSVEVYLVGSITQPYQFRKDSDVDVVLKGFEGDRFEIWTKLEGELGRRVEIMQFEKLNFQDHVVQNGLRIV